MNKLSILPYNIGMKYFLSLIGLIFITGCVSEGYVSTGVYVEPYPVYIGPPVIYYHSYYPHYYRHYYHPSPPIHHAPPVIHRSPPPPRHTPTNPSKNRR